ncbi:HNH endonuclease [Siminovitchia acidinfaciens]|uniref:HNH endonuclease n=1 Tax=Siminovitchia acidinfaciens TaxID=2321395 RepID=A0A429Y473_9BACI|nr:HNH endonuclease [Siminovitchia acidinfaciens]RST76222.1 HNH endonuclease [Siminovitchia acidinfaciens]
MPKIRPPYSTWYKNIRPIIWERDKGKCKKCGIKVSLSQCHIDHIISGIMGSNEFKNLRTLCRRCHTLRLDFNHRTLIQGAITKGIIPPHWRSLVWDEEEI